MKLIKIFFSKLKWVLIANVYSSISKFIILIVIAQFLTTAEVGVYTLGLAVTAPITLLFNMKMKSIIITEEKPNIEMYKNIRLYSNFISFLVIFLVSIFFYNDYILILSLIGVTKILDINSEFYQSLPNKYKDFHITSKLIISKFSLITVLFTIVIILTKNLVIAFIVYIAIQILHLIIEKIFFKKYVTQNLTSSSNNYYPILAFMIPLGITQMLYSFGSSIPKYMMENLGTIEQVGIFSAILYFVTVVNMLISSVFQTILPYAMNQYNLNYKKFNFFVYKISPLIIVGFSMFLYLPIYLWGEKTLEIIFGEVYAANHSLLYILVLTILFNMLAWLFDTALLVSRKIKLQPYFTLCNIIITAIFGWYLINQDVLIGATITTTIYSLLNFLYKFLYYLIRKN